MAYFDLSAKGVPIAKFSKWPIFLAELRKRPYIPILGQNRTNWYVWTRNFLKLPNDTSAKKSAI